LDAGDLQIDLSDLGLDQGGAGLKVAGLDFYGVGAALLLGRLLQELRSLGGLGLQGPLAKQPFFASVALGLVELRLGLSAKIGDLGLDLGLLAAGLLDLLAALADLGLDVGELGRRVVLGRGL